MYSFYMGDILLPITPEKFTTKIKGSNKTLTLVNEGDINFLRAPGLTEISFDAVFPMLGAYSFSRDWHQPKYYLDRFEQLMLSKTPFRFKVERFTPDGRLLYNNEMQVSLEEYTITEDASKGPDVTVAISLKQCPSYVTKHVSVVQTEEGAAMLVEETPREAENAPTAATYVVQPGDNLWKIAKKFYGDGSLYSKIYEANRDTLYNADLIYAGQELIIP